MLRIASAGLGGTIGTRALSAKPPIGLKALVFDTFGTLVDWRGSIIAEGAAWGRTKGITVDWARFADRWRAGYSPAMDKVRKGEIPWTKLDVLHRVVLEDILKEFGILGLLGSLAGRRRAATGSSGSECVQVRSGRRKHLLHDGQSLGCLGLSPGQRPQVRIRALPAWRTAHLQRRHEHHSLGRRAGHHAAAGGAPRE